MTGRHEGRDLGRGLARDGTGAVVVEGADGVAVLLLPSREVSASCEVGQRVLEALGGPPSAPSLDSSLVPSPLSDLGWALAAASRAPRGQAADASLAPSSPAGAAGRPKGAEDAAEGAAAGRDGEAGPAAQAAPGGTAGGEQAEDEPGTRALDPGGRRHGGQPHGGQRADGSVPQAALGATPLVLASLCPDGHANPPDLGRCVRCGQDLPGPLSEVRRPVLVVLTLSTGQAVPVAGDVMVGRAPQAPTGSDPEAVTLVPVPSPTHLVSRSHLAVTTAGWSVLACDLGSSNGTVLIRPERSPLLLEAGVSVPLLVGDVLDVGDGVTLRVDPPWQPHGGP